MKKIFATLMLLTILQPAMGANYVGKCEGNQLDLSLKFYHIGQEFYNVLGAYEQTPLNIPALFVGMEDGKYAKFKTAFDYSNKGEAEVFLLYIDLAASNSVEGGKGFLTNSEGWILSELTCHSQKEFEAN